MRHKPVYVLVVVFLFAITACKKKKETQPAPQPEPQPVVPGTRAVFESVKWSVVNGNSLTLSGTPSKAFYSSQDLVMNNPAATADLRDMGVVSMNSIIFKKNWGVTNIYGDSTGILNYPVPQIWNVSGNNGMGPFTYTNNSQHPGFTGYTAIPDSFVTSSGITLPLTNYTNTDEISVSMYRQNNTSIGTLTQFHSSGVTSCQYSSAELSSFGTCTDVVISLSFFKNNVVEIGGHKTNFRTTHIIQKNGVKFKP